MHYDYVKTTFEPDWVAQACHKRLRQGDSKIKFCLLQNETCPQKAEGQGRKGKDRESYREKWGGERGSKVRTKAREGTISVSEVLAAQGPVFYFQLPHKKPSAEVCV